MAWGRRLSGAGGFPSLAAVGGVFDVVAEVYCCDTRIERKRNDAAATDDHVGKAKDAVIIGGGIRVGVDGVFDEVCEAIVICIAGWVATAGLECSPVVIYYGTEVVAVGQIVPTVRGKVGAPGVSEETHNEEGRLVAGVEVVFEFVAGDFVEVKISHGINTGCEMFAAGGVIGGL
ncbi:MAG: hypothetical protein NZL93_06030 [Chthoniobacterales bacterium]|nr:hypothetical protein [Chthoniobacterales bacterium]